MISVGQRIAISALCAWGVIASPAAATTIGFGGTDVDPYVENGYSFDIARIVNGNCSDNPCMALNDNESPTLTRVSGGTFTLDSFWFQLLGTGNPNELRVRSYSGATLVDTVLFAVPGYTHNVEYTYTTPFVGITSILFDTAGGGNVRIDDINVTAVVCVGGVCRPEEEVDVVPVPGAAVLMGSALAGGVGFGAWRRRRRRPAA